MSDTVHHIGKIQHIKKNGRTLEETFVSLLPDEEKKKFSEFDIEEDIEIRIFDFAYSVFGYDEVVVVNDELFKKLTCREIGDEDVFKIIPLEDDVYEFELRYYNGGCCFTEALEEAIDNSHIKF